MRRRTVRLSPRRFAALGCGGLLPTITPRPPTITPDPAVLLAITATAEARAIKAAAPCKAGQVKANRNTGVYHLPGMRYYAQLSDNVGCFDTAGQAEAAGFRLSEK